ncbi:transcriptional regulator domain-containing protein [Serratia sp. D1N4]
MEEKVYTDFAWECLRRNPRYISDWKLAMEGERADENEIFDDTIRAQSALDLIAEKKWGLMKYVDPENPDPIDVFWSIRLSKRSIRLALSTCGDFTWGHIASKPGVHQRKLRLLDGTLCIKIFNDNGYFQFFTDSNTVLNDNASLFLYIPLSLQTDMINKNIDIIKSIINNRGEIDESDDFDEKEKSYLVFLKFIDDIKQGLTHKDIASEIFGEEVVKNEWSSDSWLRANIRYRLKKANNLINNGYLDYI